MHAESAGYTAPEAKKSKRSDLYSFGVLADRLIGNDHQTLQKSHKQLLELLRKCCELVPDKRPGLQKVVEALAKAAPSAVAPSAAAAGVQ